MTPPKRKTQGTVTQVVAPGSAKHTFTPAAVEDAVEEALIAREFMLKESSRIHSVLAAAVRAGADDATLAKLVRREIKSMGAK